ncbi:MAG: pyridoxal-phosphate-dependent aminotransferase family protein [Bacillota bacterium]
MSKQYSELNVGSRILLGPGPSDCDPKVLRAMSVQTVGHLDPDFIAVMNDTVELLRYVFQTENQMTLPMSGTGSAGMETVLVNLIEPGDRVLICVAGLFGQRMVDIAGRCGAVVETIQAPWGRIVDPGEVKKALAKGPYKLVAIVQAETSTGILQPLDEVMAMAHENGALVAVDAVTSIGGVELRVDKWGIDACYGGTQKCLSCPPGLAPVTFNETARRAVAGRRTKVQSWYLDLNMIQNYWGQERFYHHTAPVNMVYALREALRLVYEEGLERRFARHLRHAGALYAGVAAMGLRLAAQEGHRLPSLTTISVPDGVDEARARRDLLNGFGVEIGGGLGELKGKVWRVGLMGYSSSHRNVVLFLSALEAVLKAQGVKTPTGAGAAAADAYLAANPLK